MKPFIQIAALAAFCLALPARAEWVVLGNTNGTEEFFELPTTSTAPGRITLWTLTNFITPMTSLEAKQYASEKVLTTVDCATRKTGAEQVLRYSDHHAGGVLVSRMDTPLRLASVRAGSIDESLLQRICR